MELIEEVFDIRKAVESSVRLVQERASRGEIALSVDMASELPNFRGDER